MAGRVGGGWARERLIIEPSRGVFEGRGGLFSRLGRTFGQGVRRGLFPVLGCRGSGSWSGRVLGNRKGRGDELGFAIGAVGNVEAGEAQDFLGGGFAGFVFILRRRLLPDGFADGFECPPFVGVGEEPEAADLHEVWRKDVQGEAADELFGFEGDGIGLVFLSVLWR